MLLVIILVQIPAPAETRAGKLFRRGASSALCATSAIDAFQTLSLAGHHGIYESNSLFRTHHGANVPVVLGVKALICGSSLFVGGHLPAGRSGVFTGLNLAGAAVNTFTILHNRQVAKTARGNQP